MILASHDRGIVHVVVKNRKELTLTMGRIGEFYESSHKNLRNKVFTMEEFLDTFMDENGKISYFNDWSGYNIPGDRFIEFYERQNYLTRRENKLWNLVAPNPNGPYYIPFYVIVTMDGDEDTIDHELAHALYYLEPEYKKKANKLVRTMDRDVRESLQETMLKWGYGKNVLTDEINAYMATSSSAYMKKRFGWSKLSEDMKPFRDLFREYNV